jgi:hypothetical protein
MSGGGREGGLDGAASEHLEEDESQEGIGLA